MANKKALFGILDNGDGTGAGVNKVDPDTTTAASIDCAVPATVAKKSTGELTFLCLDAEGKLPVTTDTAGVCHSGHAKVTGTTAFQDLGTITAALATVYSCFEWSSSSSTEACFELIHVDDVGVTDTETVLSCWSTGPGQYSYGNKIQCLEYDTTGGTGVQEFRIQAKLLESTGSELCGTLALKEIV